MSAPFTPGPWRVKLLAPNYVEVCPESGGKPIVAWPGFDDSAVFLKQHEANARLIAAAPDLYAAVCEALDHINIDEEEGMAVLLRAAIEKAAGRR